MDESKNFHEILGAGHWVHFDRKKEFLSVLSKIVARTHADAFNE